MEFDLFTFIIQLINFGILLLILWKFLFGKIKSIMDEREKIIRNNIEESEKKKALAEELELKNQELNKKIKDHGID